HTRQVLTREAAFHVGVGAHTHEYRIVFTQQLIDGHVFADFGIQTELDTHAGEHLAAARHHGLFQLEFGDAEGQQAADFRVTVEYHRADPGPRQHVRAAETRRARTDDRHPLAGRHHLGHIRAPAHGEGSVGDV